MENSASTENINKVLRHNSWRISPDEEEKLLKIEEKYLNTSNTVLKDLNSIPKTTIKT